MNRLFSSYFARMVRSIAAFPPSAQRSADLAFVLTRIPESWRPDARYFLARNIELMILAPLRAVKSRGVADVPGVEEIYPVVSRDIMRIVALSEETSVRRDRAYVSATSVVMALGQLAPDLESTAFQIWGPD